MKLPESLNKEAQGWMTLLFMMMLFPALFFLCVWFPILVGWTRRWP